MRLPKTIPSKDAFRGLLDASGSIYDTDKVVAAYDKLYDAYVHAVQTQNLLMEILRQTAPRPRVDHLLVEALDGLAKWMSNLVPGARSSEITGLEAIGRINDFVKAARPKPEDEPDEEG